MSDPLSNYLTVGTLLFALGALGFLTRRNLILMMLSGELMLHGISLNLVAFSATHQNFQGQAFTAFVLTVAACEAGLALALILVLYRRRQTLDINAWDELTEVPPPPDDRPGDVSEPITADEELPRLVPAGSVPDIEGQHQTRPPAPTKPVQETKSHV